MVSGVLPPLKEHLNSVLPSLICIPLYIKDGRTLCDLKSLSMHLISYSHISTVSIQDHVSAAIDSFGLCMHFTDASTDRMVMGKDEKYKLSTVRCSVSFC